MKKVLIITGISLFAFVIVVVLLNSMSGESNKKKINDYVTEQGYKTSSDSLFYQKIVSNNTLDNFYDDVDHKRDSEYEEYYFSKDSYSFIELKMIYKNGINQVFNVTSDFTNNKITYNFEISKDNQAIMLEGSHIAGKTNCNLNNVRNMSTKNMNEYCTIAENYMSEFLNEQDTLLSNEEFRQAISQVNGVVIDD